MLLIAQTMIDLIAAVIFPIHGQHHIGEAKDQTEHGSGNRSGKNAVRQKLRRQRGKAQTLPLVSDRIAAILK